MKTKELIADLRSRINPAYATQRGTESYERRLCAEALEEMTKKKEWVGLTRDERMAIINKLSGEDWVYAIDAIETKLKEKNHG